MKNKETFSTYKICLIAMMAAVVYVVTMFRFPFMGTKVHFANAMCLLSGLLFGPVGGGLAAGLGSGLNDLLYGGYGIVDALVTFVSKFAMAFICAHIAGVLSEKDGKEPGKVRLIIASVIGALSYVVLYMIKTFIFQKFVYGFPDETVFAAMAAKLPGSLINAVFAMVVAPIFYAAVKPALAKVGLLKKLR